MSRVRCAWSIAGGWVVDTDVEVHSNLYSKSMLLPPAERELAHALGASTEMLAALRAVAAELIGPERPYSADSYLPPHIVDQVRDALAKASPV